MKTIWLPLLILLMGTVYIFFIPDEPLGFKLLFKLIPMGLIVLFALQGMPKKKRPLHRLISYYAAQFFIAYSIRGFVKNSSDM